MLKNLLGVIALALVAAGCAGVKADTYVMDKPRVGIEYAGGNAGYIFGKPQYEEPAKKTRRTYVLELSKPISEKEVKKIHEETSTQIHETTNVPETAPSTTPAPAAYENQNRPLVITPIEDEPAPVQDAAGSEGPQEAVSYTVEKDDTLQKISKKFYGSYGKWTKIYEANKDTLKNPNFVRPGTVLTIPAKD